MLKFNKLGQDQPQAKGNETPPNKIERTAENLLKHIPGEASGFYVMTASALGNNSTLGLGILFFGSLFILLFVRYFANASKWVFSTTIFAFLLWMTVIDNGFIKVILESQIQGFEIGPWGLIAAIFYSVIVTILANSGKIE